MFSLNRSIARCPAETCRFGPTSLFSAHHFLITGEFWAHGWFTRQFSQHSGNPTLISNISYAHVLTLTKTWAGDIIRILSEELLQESFRENIQGRSLQKKPEKPQPALLASQYSHYQPLGLLQGGDSRCSVVSLCTDWIPNKLNHSTIGLEGSVWPLVAKLLPFCFRDNHQHVDVGLFASLRTKFTHYFFPIGKIRLVFIIIMNENLFVMRETPAGWKCLRFYSFTYWNQTAQGTKLWKRPGCPGNHFFPQSADRSCNLFLAFLKERNTIAEKCWQQVTKDALFVQVVEILVCIFFLTSAINLCFCKTNQIPSF